MAGQVIAEFETSKTTFELHAPVAGIVQHQHPEGAEIAVGSLVCIISEDGRAPFPEESRRQGEEAQATPTVIPVKPQSPLSVSAVASFEHPSQGQRFSAKARELLTRLGLDPARFPKRGLVRAQDVRAGFESLGAGTRPAEGSVANRGEGANVIPVPGVPYRTEELLRSKRLEIAYLRSGMQHALPSAVTLACPTCGLRAAAEQAGVNLSGVLVYEVGSLLRKYPAFNGFFADDRQHFYEEVNIGFAFDAGRGLKVPVVCRADDKSLPELDQELRELMVQYLNDELPVESLAGGTFTITDLSQEGATFFNPLLSQRQSAILGVGAELLGVGQNEGCFHITLAFDHQLSNGREATQFLIELSRRLAGYEKAWVGAQREEPYCHHCERTLSTLSEIKAHLVAEVGMDGVKGRVCSLCLRGL